MLHAPAMKARSEGAARGRAADAQPEVLVKPPAARNQALVRMQEGAPPRQRPSRMPLLQRQCACGGTCASCRDEATKLQTKLTIDEPGDEYEQEADRVADRVMRMAAPAGQSKVETGLLQRRTMDTAPLDGAPPIVGDVLRSPGQPLDAETRAFMEPRFGADFSAVRVHIDAQAAASARAVNAHAYTVGRDIIFADRQHPPRSEQGYRLMAHELTHVLQPGGGLHRQVRVEPASEVTDILDQFTFICPSGGFAANGGEIVGNCVSSVNTGCDCLCDVAEDPRRLYTIQVEPATTSFEGAELANQTSAMVPQTSVFPETINGENPVIRMPASSGSDVEFGAFRPDGSADWADNWRILGHELCGHGRLRQSYAGDAGDREGHNATIDVENQIAAEHGGDARGHFADPRQGESFFNPVGDRTRIRFSQVDGLHYDPP